MVVSLNFRLDIIDDWPPVGSESLPFEQVLDGFRGLEPPLFVKNLSVGDFIQIQRDTDGYVSSWDHIEQSGNSTVWLLRLQQTDSIAPCLQQLRSLGCNTASQDKLGCYSIDVPATIELSEIDQILGELDPNVVAIAFPSLRHLE